MVASLLPSHPAQLPLGVNKCAKLFPPRLMYQRIKVSYNGKINISVEESGPRWTSRKQCEDTGPDPPPKKTNKQHKEASDSTTEAQRNKQLIQTGGDHKHSKATPRHATPRTLPTHQLITPLQHWSYTHPHPVPVPDLDLGPGSD